GLAHQDQAGGDVPGRQVALPIAVEASGRDPGEIERGGAEAAQSRHLVLQHGDLLARQRKVAAAVMWQAADDDRIDEPGAAGHAQAAVVEEGALAALGGEQLVIGGIVDEAGDDRVLALERDRDAEMRDAVQEIGGAVERVDDQAMRLVGAFVAAAFLAEKAVAGPRMAELLAQDFLGATIG